MTLREYRCSPVPIPVSGHADTRVPAYQYRHESRCFLEQYIHLHIADPFYGTAGHLIASDGEFQGEDYSQRDA